MSAQDTKKTCPHCHAENAIATQTCHRCGFIWLSNVDTLPIQPEENPRKTEDPLVARHDGKTIIDVSLSEKHKKHITATLSNAHPGWAVRSEVNQREQNEDSFQIYELLTPASPDALKILAIADGMGGHAYGERVSREVLRTVSHALFEKCVVNPTLNELASPFTLDAQKIVEMLGNVLEEANARVQQMVRSNKWGRAGSTLVLAVILHDTLITTNLGDSPLFLYQSRSKKLRKITEDHTVAGVLVRKRIITPEMARHHEGRSRLEFYVGADSLPKYSPIYQCALVPGDLILLCTDGISGCLSLEQIEKMIGGFVDNLEALANRLIEASLEANETDNQTLILWRYSPAR